MSRRLFCLTACGLLLGCALFCSCAETLYDWASPSPDPGQAAALRREAEGIVRSREDCYGHLPPHRWPPHERELYESAKRTLAELKARGR